MQSSFITINCRVRGKAQLTSDDLPGKIFSAISHYQQNRRWWPEIVLLMPDHLHALISFPWEQGQGMGSVIGQWKRYTAKAFGIGWQRDYFDHRIRSDADHLASWAYIRENPVRSGLVGDYADWPHVWFPERTGWDSGKPS
ncbi:MAG: hypothetical protein EOP87_15680 [Verrucomicrobiaceae bacterium]|nr:MAG: hypothetical protein EOP87_15680 [Verrucomicrobiaceae bacterium]